MNYAIGLMGMWLFSDGIYSWVLYHNAQCYNGGQQTFWRDHWIRLIRILIGVVLMVIGGVN